MSAMFASCSSLTSLDLRSFDTSSVERREGMFDGCDNLTEVVTDNQKVLNTYASK